MNKNILQISDNEYHYSSGYFTANIWIDNDTIVLKRSKNPSIGIGDKEYKDNCELVLVSLNDINNKIVIDGNIEGNALVWQKKIYYANTKAELIEFDLETHKKEIIFKSDYKNADGNLIPLHTPQITNDGRYICTFLVGEKSLFFTIDVLEKKVVDKFEKNFAVPFTVANHAMICPTNHQLMFFAHEGVTYYISNRLWLYNAEKGYMKNIAKQSLDADGNLADCYGHEMWAPDGKGIYFVKYCCSPQPPNGICYVDIENGETKLLYSKYNYWHVGVSSDGKYLVSDTSDEKDDMSRVVLIDRKRNTETIIDKVHTTWQHPCHPHPQLSPDNSKIVYCALENDRVCVKVMNLFENL